MRPAQDAPTAALLDAYWLEPDSPARCATPCCPSAGRTGGRTRFGRRQTARAARAAAVAVSAVTVLAALLTVWTGPAT
ncbi:hypothetical protein [Streptomyces sp. NPDC055749]